MNHTIVTMSYDGVAIPGHEIHRAIEEVLENRNSSRITVQTIPYFVTPNQLGLREVWMNMSDIEREQLAEGFPALATAIHCMVLGTQVPGEPDVRVGIDFGFNTDVLVPVDPKTLPLLRDAGKNSREVDEWLSLEPSDVNSEEHMRWQNHLRDLRSRPQTLE